jgi:hypothetical protein
MERPKAEANVELDFNLNLNLLPFAFPLDPWRLGSIGLQQQHKGEACG